MHRRGLFHGDIKPSNIGFTGDGVAKFLDFGLAQFAVDLADEAGDSEEDPKRTNDIVGTPAYMSPEVCDGAPRGPEMDVWALCVVLRKPSSVSRRCGCCRSEVLIFATASNIS